MLNRVAECWGLALGAMLAGALFAEPSGKIADGMIDGRPYEMVWANRTADERPPLLPLVSAAGWHAETQNAEVRLESCTVHRLFGEGVMRVNYRATGTNPRFRLLLDEPAAVPEGADAFSVWIWGNSLAYGGRPKTPPISIVALFRDAAGREFSFPVYTMFHFEWHLRYVMCPVDLRARLAKGAKFLGFALAGGSNTDWAFTEFTSLNVFREPWRPIHVKPHPRRPVRLFPNQDPGANTGEGTLPFPNVATTVVPPEALSAEAGRLELRPPSKAYVWDDMAIRWDKGPWRRFAVGGGLFPAPPEPAKDWRREGDALVRGGVRLRLVGTVLSVEVERRGGEVSRVNFGALGPEAAQDAKLVQLPYFTVQGGQRPSVVRFDAGKSRLFHLAFADWTQSNGSDLDPGCGVVYGGGRASNGAVLYNPKTDGRRNDVYERLVYAFSPTFADVLPNIPNPVSPYKDLTAPYTWVHVYLGRGREPEYPRWRDYKRRHLDRVIVHDWETCMRDGNESFTFRTTAAPGKGGDAGMRAFSDFLCRELGYLYGPYNNYCDFAPVNAYWSSDRVERRSDGNLITSWNRCYSPRPTWCPEACAEIVPILQRKYAFNTGYCDVQTCVSPWSRTDYDHRAPGAGTFAQTWYAYGLTLLNQRKGWGGPVYSEGGHHYLYCGLNDGNFAQDQTYGFQQAPWIVDFDLLRLHPLANNFGMGYFDMFYPRKGIPKDPDVALDRFLAATVAFGHIGLFHFGRDEDDLYWMVSPLSAHYAKAGVTARSIRYFGSDGRPRTTSQAIDDDSIARSQIMVDYSEGTKVVANGSWKNWLEHSVDGGRVHIPPNGFLAYSGDGKVGVASGMKDGHRLNLSVSPEAVWLNARGVKRVTAFGGSDGGLERYFLPGNREEVFLRGKATFAVLPFAATKVVKLDKAGKELGEAAFRVENGRTVIDAQKGAYSFVATRPAGYAERPAREALKEFFVAADAVRPADADSNGPAVGLTRYFWTAVHYRGKKPEPLAAASGARFNVGGSTCGGVTRSGFNSHPPWHGGTGAVSATWELKLPERPLVFKSYVGIEDGHLKSDGVTFRVYVTCDGKKTKLLDVHHVPVAWEPVAVRLAKYAGKTILFTLESDCGPANDTSCDNGIWGEPTFEFEKNARYERELAGFNDDRDRWIVNVGERVEAPTNGLVTVRIPQGEWGFWADYASFPGMQPIPGPTELVLEQETDLRGHVALIFAEYLGENTPGPRIKVKGRLDKVTRFVTGLDPKKRYQLKTLEVRPDNPERKELRFAVRRFRGVFETPLAEAVTAEVETGNPLFLVREGRNERAELVFANPCAQEVALAGTLEMKGPAGERLPVAVDCRVPGCGRRAFALPGATRKGVWLVQGGLRCPDGSVKSVDTRFAKIDCHQAGPKQPYGTFRFGINYHMERYAPYDRRLTIAALNACGAKLVRSSIGMKVADVLRKPGLTEMDFSKADRLLGELERAGLSVDAGSFGIPKWLARADFQTNKVWQTWHISLAPSNVIERVAEAVARRYGTRVDYYECGNEWDLGFRHPVADAIEVQRQFYTGLKRGNPKVKVITNGWTVPGNNEQINRSGHENFQEEFLKAAKDWFDVYPVHIHSALPNYVHYVEDAMFPLLRRTGCGDKPWYSNETALTTHGHGERKAAEHIWKKILYAWSKGSRDYIWYNLRGTGWDPSDAEQAYGLVRADYRPRETYAAFAALTAILGGGTFRKAHCGEAGRYVLEFADAAGRPVLVAWDGNGTRAVFTGFTLATDAAKVERIDLFGNRAELRAVDGKVRFEFGNEPAALVLTGATKVVPDAKEVGEIPTPAGMVVDIPADAPGRKPDFVLDRHAQVTDFFEANPAEVKRLWKGPHDTSANVWLASTADGIRLRVDVVDDVHAPAEKGGMQYCGDDVQVHFSTRRRRGGWEFGLAQARGGAPDVFCWYAPNGFKTGDAAAQVRLAVTREGTTTRYVAFFPLAALGFDARMLREGVRFNLMVNDNDGTGRDLTLETVRGSFKDSAASPVVRFR